MIMLKEDCRCWLPSWNQHRPYRGTSKIFNFQNGPIEMIFSIKLNWTDSWLFRHDVHFELKSKLIVLRHNYERTNFSFFKFFYATKVMIFRQKPKSGLVFFARNWHYLAFFILRPYYFITSVSHYLRYLDRLYAARVRRNAFSKKKMPIWQTSTDEYEVNGWLALKIK